MINKKGFTLVEVIVVAIIVGMLAMMTIPSMLGNVNRSYAQDAMRNLAAIYAAQQNYYQNNGSTYKTCADLACINSAAGLDLQITPAMGSAMTYSCAATECSVVAPASAGGFTMTVDLTKPVSLNVAPVYCDASMTVNPCCEGGTAGHVCP